jgi:hypothetical protein
MDQPAELISPDDLDVGASASASASAGAGGVGQGFQRAGLVQGAVWALKWSLYSVPSNLSQGSDLDD